MVESLRWVSLLCCRSSACTPNSWLQWTQWLPTFLPRRLTHLPFYSPGMPFTYSRFLPLLLHLLVHSTVSFHSSVCESTCWKYLRYVGDLVILGLFWVHLERWGAGVVFFLKQGVNDLHMVQLMPLPPHHLLLHYNPEWFTFMVRVYPFCPWKEAVKWL